MYELIIAEKPDAGMRIAMSLADGKPVKKGYKGVPYYEITRGKKDIVVGCAVGHLYTLDEKEKTKGFEYPVFDIEWVPAAAVHKESAFSKKYLDALKQLAKKATKFTVATDFDVEGSLIGLNVLRFACNQADARRMKFSTLTKPDLIEAYEHASQHLDLSQAEAGETRHFLDYYYGINISRALMSAIKKAGVFKILSAGRVQAPALKIIVEREREIMAFKPVPFWQIGLQGEAKSQPVVAWHRKNPFWKKEDAELVMSHVKGAKEAAVVSVEKKESKQLPPAPFDLTVLQTESYRCFGISPRKTLEIAQELYTQGLISYPRTSSQQLPHTIGYRQILGNLQKQQQYREKCAFLLKQQSLLPNNGKKTDPAHPAIYPTGEQASGLDQQSARIYDLVVRRFFATFGKAAVREAMAVELDAKKEPFVAKGIRTVEPGWYLLYEPYITPEESILPDIKENDRVKIKKIQAHEKQTQPPKRYNEASIIKELEKRGLGTKSTRAAIIGTLYNRNYVTGRNIEATVLGMHIVDILQKHCPKILDEELTRHFEEDMDAVREGKEKEAAVLGEAQIVLREISHDFHDSEDKIGEGLKATFTETRAAMQTIGACPNCEKGSLIIRKGKFGRFAACNSYPECKTTFSLPSNGLIEAGEKKCAECSHPYIKVIRKGKRPQEVCINPNCPSKRVDEKIEEKKCTKCNEGKMVLRKSIYGAFLACNRYPKCRNIERINHEK